MKNDTVTAFLMIY